MDRQPYARLLCINYVGTLGDEISDGIYWNEDCYCLLRRRCPRSAFLVWRRYSRYWA